MGRQLSHTFVWQEFVQAHLLRSTVLQLRTVTHLWQAQAHKHMPVSLCTHICVRPHSGRERTSWTGSLTQRLTIRVFNWKGKSFLVFGGLPLQCGRRAGPGWLGGWGPQQVVLAECFEGLTAIV